MSITRIVRPLGLVTQPNKVGSYPDGALALARGVFMRDPNVLTTQGAITSLATAPWDGTALGPIFIGHVLDSNYTGFSLYLNASSTWRFSWWNSVGTPIGDTSMQFNSSPSVSPTPSAEVLTTERRFSWTVNGKRLVIPFRDSVVQWVLNPAVTPAPELCGLGPPTLTSSGLTTTQGGALANNTACHVVAVHRRVMWDGTEVVSAPSNAIYMANGLGAAANLLYDVRGMVSKQVGDFIDVYRTHAQNATSPSTYVNTGADYFKACSYEITNAAASNYGITDTTADQNLGEALYTNQGVRGAASANLMPPKCKAVATFKGHTFYLNVTEPPVVRYGYAVGSGGMGDSTTGSNAYTRANAIGIRTVVGSVTNGGTTITGISAADMVGIKVGQRFFNGTVGVNSTPATITSIGANMISISPNTWTGTNASASQSFGDVIEFDGVVGAFSNSNAPMDDHVRAVASGALIAQVLDRIYPPVGTGSLQSVATIPADSIVWTRPTSMNSTAFGALTIRATNGANYSPPLPEYSSGTRSYNAINLPNLLRWSEQNQPGACPSSNRAFCGVGEIYAGAPTRDCLWIFASDGLWRLSGNGGVAPDYDWRLDPVDATLSLAGPNAWCVFRDDVYAYTNRGFVRIDSSGGVTELTLARCDNLLPGSPWNASATHVFAADELNDEIVILVQGTNDPFIYNTRADAFTQYDASSSGIGTPLFISFARSSQLLYFCHIASGIRRIASGATSTGSMQVEYQPIYGEDTWAKHRWQRVHYLWDQLNSPLTASVQPIFNGLLYSSRTASTVASAINDLTRMSMVVDRNAPAVSNNIKIGYVQPSGQTQMLRLFGLAVEYVPMTNQRVRRSQ